MAQYVDRAAVISAAEARALAHEGIAGTGVYIGGPAQGGAADSWTPAKVQEISAAVPDWTFIPFWVAPTITGDHSYGAGVSSGHVAGAAAAEFGWHKNRGRVIFLDTERSTYTDREGHIHPEWVTPFVQGFYVGAMDAGYLPGQYGGRDLLEAVAKLPVLPAFAFLAHYTRTGGSWDHSAPPHLSAEPSLAPWGVGARAGWQHWNEVIMLPGHSAFDLSVAYLPTNP